VVASLPARTSAAKLNESQIQPLNLDLRQVTDSSKKNVLTNDNEPPPAPRPLLKPVSGGVLNGKAISLPAPTYPELARRMRTGGKVEVEVIVDENGKVISAHASSGPTALRDVAVEAALRARFTPTKLSGQPVKIAGRIDYNFTLP
jgi:TonB family protein